jgi:hypothetical protein
MSTEQQAFPAVVDGYLYDGMTLRDYFAATAMQGLLANGNTRGANLIRLSYQIADEMMEERNKIETNTNQLL